MSIVLGLSAALAWGLADFGARFATRQVGNIRAFLYMQLVGLVMISGWLLIYPPEIVWQWHIVAVAVLICISNTFAGLALYRAFEIGLISIIAPVAASSGIIVLPLSILTGQKFLPWQIVGLLGLIVGVILASTSFSLSKKEPVLFEVQEKKFRGVGLAFLSATFFGFSFLGLSFITPSLGGIVPVFGSRLIGPIITLAFGLVIGQNIKLPGWSALPLIAGIGVLDTLAFVCYMVGIRSPEGGMVAVISTLFSAVTVLLASIFLREKLAANQWVGVGLILTGVVLVGAG
ncbi:MAG: family transporter [Chloroflexi bacterium]|jgi:drug/metabolite transporter (DMT)-like permease|nr:family transporter [Chloroflexota bacterium]